MSYETTHGSQLEEPEHVTADQIEIMPQWFIRIRRWDSADCQAVDTGISEHDSNLFRPLNVDPMSEDTIHFDPGSTWMEDQVWYDGLGGNMSTPMYISTDPAIHRGTASDRSILPHLHEARMAGDMGGPRDRAVVFFDPNLKPGEHGQTAAS